jgi:hypothetical protein
VFLHFHTSTSHQEAEHKPCASFRENGDKLRTKKHGDAQKIGFCASGK